MLIFCTTCNADVEAVLIDGSVVYPHRKDLYDHKFYSCPHCNNFVSTTKSGRPLGVIASPEIKKMRKKIHKTIDPLWENGIIDRSALYKRISTEIGKEYHTANIRSVVEANYIFNVVSDVRMKILMETEGD